MGRRDALHVTPGQQSLHVLGRFVWVYGEPLGDVLERAGPPLKQLQNRLLCGRETALDGNAFDIRDDLRRRTEHRGKFAQPAARNGHSAVLGGWPGHGVQLDPVRLDAPDALDDLSGFGRDRRMTAHEEDF